MAHGDGGRQTPSVLRARARVRGSTQARRRHGRVGCSRAGRDSANRRRKLTATIHNLIDNVVKGVADKGIGISQADQKIIFEIFARSMARSPAPTAARDLGSISPKASWSSSVTRLVCRARWHEAFAVAGCERSRAGPGGVAG